MAAIVFLIPRTSPPPLAPQFNAAVDRKFARYTGGRLVPQPGSFLHKLGALDVIGTVLLLAIVTMLVLVLQWGGNKHAWNSAIIIGLLVGFGVLLGLFVAFEALVAPPLALLKTSLYRNRTQVRVRLSARC